MDVLVTVRLWLILLFGSLMANSAYANIYLNDAPSQSLTSDALFLEDPSHLFTPNMILSKNAPHWFESSSSVPNFGHTNSAYWMKVTLTNPGKKDQERIISLKTPLTDFVSFYVIKDQSIIDSYTIGDRVSFNIRRIPHPHPSLKVKIEGNSSIELLVRQLSSTPIIFDMDMMPPEHFYQEHMYDTAKSSFYYGILSLLVIFSLYTFWIIREPIFLIYAAFIFFRVLVQSSIDGYAFQYLFPNWPILQNFNLIVFACLSIGLFAAFTREIFNVTNQLRNALNVLTATSFAPVLIMFSSLQFALIVTKLIGIVMVFACLGIACYYAKLGIRIACYYIFSVLILLTTTTYFILTRFGWVPHSDLTAFIFQFGLLAEVILLVILVSRRFKQEARQRALAEYSALKKSQHTDNLEQLLQHRAFHHQKNDLPNDLLLHKNYQQLVSTNDFNNQGLVFLKAHQFKEFDRTLGANCTDRLTQALASYLNETLCNYPSIVTIEDSDSGPLKVAAMDASSFVLLVNAESEKKVESLCRSLADHLSQPFNFESINLDLNVRIGYTFHQRNPSLLKPTALDISSTEMLDELIRRAKIAAGLAYQKKTFIQAYNESEDLFNERRLSLAAELRSALEEDLLTLAYQPQMDLKTGTCCGIEALLRWKHAEHGYINTEEFILLAEQNGLIKPLTLWVVNQALREFKEIRTQQDNLQLSINISVLNLHEPKFLKVISDALIATNTPPNQLTLEVTESSLVTNDQQEMITLEGLKRLGIQVSIDDYGTGYSGLSQIHNLAAQELKIDKSFVFEMNKSQSARTIVKTSIDMAHDLNMTVVAEGVETLQAEELLIEMGCDISQGYHYSKPVSNIEIIEWLKQHAS